MLPRYSTMVGCTYWRPWRRKYSPHAAGVNGAALLLLRLCLLYGHAAGQTAQIDAVIRADQHDNQAGNTADFSAAATAARAGTASVFDIVAAALVVQFHGDSFNSMDK